MHIVLPGSALEATLNRVHISCLETGRRGPELEMLLILAEALDVPVQRLVEGAVGAEGAALQQKRQPPNAEASLGAD